jgi:tripartite-type tricarboxylate transporter receptor subunit TctC
MLKEQMTMTKSTRITFLIGSLALFSSVAFAQGSNKPMQIISPNAAGGPNDLIARMIAPKLGELLGQNVVVDDRPSANGVVGAEMVARATPDGSVIAIGNSGTHAVNATLYRQLPYDPVRDFAPITLAATAPNVLVVNPALPAKSLAEFVALAKAKPGALSYGTPGIGTSPHLSMELLKSMAGIDLQHVPYRGTAAAVTDVIGGQIAATFANALTAKPHVDSGRVRALAVSGPSRVEAFPTVPTVAEAGVPGYEAMQWYGMVAPAGTPPQIIARLHAEAAKALQSSEMKEKLALDGAQPVGSTPAEFAALIRRELDKWTRVVRAAGIELQ